MAGCNFLSSPRRGTRPSKQLTFDIIWYLTLGIPIFSGSQPEYCNLLITGDIDFASSYDTEVLNEGWHTAKPRLTGTSSRLFNSNMDLGRVTNTESFNLLF